MLPRVAVIGGGLTGSLCALSLVSRGLQPVVFDGGRGLGGRSTAAHFLTTADPHLSAVLGTLAQNKLVAPWAGRFGIVGSKGGFLAAQHVASGLGGRSLSSDPEDVSSTLPQAPIDEGDFCGFLAASSPSNKAASPLHCAVGGGRALAAGICELGGIDVRSSSKVTSLQLDPASSRWTVRASSGSPAPEVLEFDAVVIASHDPSFAASAIADLPAEHPSLADDVVRSTLADLAKALRDLREEATSPVFTLKAV